MGTGQSRGFAGGPSANSPGEPSPAQLYRAELLLPQPLRARKGCICCPSATPVRAGRGGVSFPWLSGTQLALHVRITWVLLKVAMSRPVLGYGPSIQGL